MACLLVFVFYLLVSCLFVVIVGVVGLLLCWRVLCLFAGAVGFARVLFLSICSVGVGGWILFCCFCAGWWWEVIVWVLGCTDLMLVVGLVFWLCVACGCCLRFGVDGCSFVGTGVSFVWN